MCAHSNCADANICLCKRYKARKNGPRRLHHPLRLPQQHQEQHRLLHYQRSSNTDVTPAKRTKPIEPRQPGARKTDAKNVSVDERVKNWGLQ